MNLNMVTTALHGISEALFPSNIYCVVCGSLIDSSRPYALCDACVKKMHWINGTDIEGKPQSVCEKCGKAIPGGSHRLCFDCMRQEHAFRKGFSCLTYGLHERELLMKLKYSGHGYLGRVFGDILFDRMKGELAALQLDLVVPVPVSEGRFRRRGYNQSAVMGRQFMRRWRQEANAIETETKKTDAKAGMRGFTLSIPAYDEYILVRIKETAMLRSMNPAERALAMREAFAVKAGTEDRIAGKTILLIDDIYTTGATLDAASRTLLSAGAACTYILTLASGGNRRPTGT